MSRERAGVREKFLAEVEDITHGNVSADGSYGPRIADAAERFYGAVPGAPSEGERKDIQRAAETIGHWVLTGKMLTHQSEARELAERLAALAARPDAGETTTTAGGPAIVTDSMSLEAALRFTLRPAEARGVVEEAECCGETVPITAELGYVCARPKGHDGPHADRCPPHRAGETEAHIAAALREVAVARASRPGQYECRFIDGTQLTVIENALRAVCPCRNVVDAHCTACGAEATLRGGRS